MTVPDRLANPHRIGLTDAERAHLVHGGPVRTNGLGRTAVAHLNLDRSLRHVYAIVAVPNGNGRFFWVWRDRLTGVDERVEDAGT